MLRVAAAQPLDGGRAAAVCGSVAETADAAGGYGGSFPRASTVTAGRFGALGLLPATVLAQRLRTEEGRALLAGMAAHSIRPLTGPLTGAFGLTMLLAHTTGWPAVQGGNGRLVAAMTAELTELGGSVATGTWIKSLADLPKARAVLLDVTPRQLLEMAGDRLPPGYRRAMRGFRYGPGVCKVDWALDGPVPWLNEVCRQTVTVHAGGTLGEVARGEAAVAAGRHPGLPFCLVTQPGVVDQSRAPAGKQVLWAYCHVPAGSDVDMADRIEAQIERPGRRCATCG